MGPYVVGRNFIFLSNSFIKIDHFLFLLSFCQLSFIIDPSFRQLLMTTYLQHLNYQTSPLPPFFLDPHIAMFANLASSVVFLIYLFK